MIWRATTLEEIILSILSFSSKNFEFEAYKKKKLEGIACISQAVSTQPVKKKKNEKYLKNNTNNATIMLFTCIRGISGSSIFRA